MWPAENLMCLLTLRLGQLLEKEVKPAAINEIITTRAMVHALARLSRRRAARSAGILVVIKACASSSLLPCGKKRNVMAKLARWRASIALFIAGASKRKLMARSRENYRAPLSWPACAHAPEAKHKSASMCGSVAHRWPRANMRARWR